MNLLFVDDEIISVQGMLSGVRWEECGISQVYTALSAKEAREVYEKEHIDIVLLDIEMPEESGLSFLQWLRERDPKRKIPCAFLTCHAEFRYATEAIKLGCMDYILKPVNYRNVEMLVIKMALSIEEDSKTSRLAKYGELWFQEKVDETKEYQKAPLNIQEIIDDTVTYIMKHLSERVSVNELADRVHLNPDYLNRIFKRYKGISINKYIIQERMALARELLSKGNLSASAVAVEVGYENYTNFIKLFKKVYGKLPSQITELNHKND